MNYIFHLRIKLIKFENGTQLKDGDYIVKM